MEVYRIAAKLLLLFSICAAIAYSAETKQIHHNNATQQKSRELALYFLSNISLEQDPTATPEVSNPTPAPTPNPLAQPVKSRWCPWRKTPTE